MNLVRNLSLTITCLLSGMLYGQTLIVVINPIVQVPVGGVFTVSGTVSHDPTSAAILAGTPVDVTIQVLDPSGNQVLASPPIQDFAGFNAGRVLNFSQIFTMPWSEDDKWNPAATWNASVSASSPVSPLVNATLAFPLLIADLTLQVNGPTTAAPGDFVDLTGVVRNLAAVQTEPGVFFKVEAYIPNTTFIHSVVFPPAGSWTPGNPWPIGANMDNNFTIPNFYVPPGTPDGPLQITVEVDDPDPVVLGVPIFEVIHEQDDLINNVFTHTINIVSGTATLQPSTDFLINGGQEGTFQGLDAVRCTVSLRNVGTGPVATGNAFDYRVFLSNDTAISIDDFLLRQVDLGSTGLGNGLLPNESITLDWVQMLPDNFEGDYYVVTDLNGVLLNARSTPGLTLRSENAVNIEQENTDDINGRTARPSSSQNGLFLAYEAFDGNITRIILKNIATTATWDLTIGIEGANPNGSSYAPQVSADGRYVVFHSLARNLSPADNNNHADVFRYDIHQRRLVLLSQGETGKSSDGSSFYPTINAEGTMVAFETHSSNLDPSATTSGKQIMLWSEEPRLPGSGTGTFTIITKGNAASFDASISGDGTRIAFTTYATDLVAGETDDNGNPDVVLWENGNYYYAGRAEDGTLPENGETKEPVISSDGTIISFVSSARNMVTGKGIAHIRIEDAGVGYPAGSTVLINDVNGSGASVRISSLNPYGEIVTFAVDNPGRNYVNPTLTVATPGTAPLPDRNVSAIPLLVNPEGDVFRITVDAVKSGGGSERVSESRPLDGDAGSETGGNLGSREPSISKDGSFVVYSTRSSNLQDLNVTSTSVKTFANRRFRPATAQAVLHWGIGSVIITNPGSGYLGTGTAEIEDLSGSGSGAVATYSVLQTGQIANVTIVNPGSGYNLSATTLSILNDNTGSGFAYQIQGSPGRGLGANRTGGATIQRIEMIDTGSGYPAKLNSFLESPEILVDGDGADLDLDGKPDARLNPDRLFTASDGKVYLEQQIDFTIKNRRALIGSALSIGDSNQTIVLSFASSPQGANVLGVDFDVSGNAQTDSGLRNDLIATIRNFWGSPTDIFAGPLIENNATGGNSFTLRALNGSATSNNLSSLQVSFRSNMLIGGSGYTRATPFVTPAPSVIGFSEVQTGTSTFVAPNGRPIFDAQEDLLTDDIYYYDHNFSQNRRISVSKFGFPTNYLTQATLPSHRYPSLSGNGRYVFFSSDASGLGGLLMGLSNQIPIGVNATRDIYKVDIKTRAINHLEAIIDINLDLFEKTNYVLTNEQMMPVIVDATIPQGYLSLAHMYVNGDLTLRISPVGIVRNAARFIFPFTPTREGYTSIHIVVEDSFGNTYRADTKIDVNVVPPEPEVMTGQMLVNPTTLGKDEIFIIHRNSSMQVDLATGGTLQPSGSQIFTSMNIVTGPHTEADIDSMIAFNDARIDPGNDAYFASDAPLNFRPFFDLYPQRLRITRSSSVNVSANFINGYGKRSNLEKVIFYLNGDILYEDVTAPYGVTFSPPLLNDDNKTISNNWVVTAQAIPLDGSRSFMLHRLGESDGEIIMPSAVLSFTDEEVSQSGEVLDGARVGVKLTLRGESVVLAGLFDTNEDPFSDDANASYDKKAHFIVNGIPLSASVGVPIIDPSGEFTQVDYYAMLNADFTQFSEPDGTLRIQALGEMSVFQSFTPVYASNILTLRIKEPMPWLDPLSAAVSVFNDISDANLTKEEHARMEFLMQSGENGLANWVEELTTRASFQQRVSILASYQIVTGEWFESYFDLEDAITAVDLNSTADGITRLKRYIDQTLTSTRYAGQFGTVPYLVGAFQMSNTFNFDGNRRSFVEQCLTNKYSYLENAYNPSFQQLFQGSQRMLTRWAAFEPDYWELPTVTGTPPLTGFDSPPRRDSLTVNSFAAGECAVDLIYNMANETQMQGGGDDTSSFIVYSENIRGSIYRKATLMSLLWRANAFPLDNKFLREISSVSFDEAIKILLEDSRYTSRHNLIWRDSSPIGNVPNWKNENWFGNFYDKHFPWVYHEHLGWLYMGGVTPIQFWFHHQTLGWLWTGNKYYPQAFSNNEQNWIYLYPENNAYYSHGTQTVKSF